MPPKAKGSGNKKADAKKAERIIEDKTFGLKNKSKSKKVQQYVSMVTAQTKHNVGLKHQTEAEKAAAAKAKKEAKDREDAELKLLFAQLQSGATKKQKAAEAAMEAAKAKREAEMLEKGGGKMEWIELDMTGKPLEEVIEYERSKLAFFKKNVTPVNEQTFAQWKKDKAEARKRENAERVAKELAKKTKGKGLSVLSGKALFEYDASLFVDDEEATDEKVDVTKLKSLMEHDEEETAGDGEGGEPPEGGEGADGLAVAVQESLYLDGDGDEDLDDIEDDDDDDGDEEAKGEGGGAGGEGGKG